MRTLIEQTYQTRLLIKIPLVQAVPKAELHVHLEGTAPPELIQRIAARNGVPLPDRLLGSDGRFRYTDFLDFLRTYDLAASVIRTGEDYRDISYEYLCGCARDGAIYVELTASRDHARIVGLTDRRRWIARCRRRSTASDPHRRQAPGRCPGSVHPAGR